MPDNLTAIRLREQIPAIIQGWDDRVRAEVTAAAPREQTILRNSLPLMLEVMAKVLADETDARTAARDLSYFTLHAAERAQEPTYSLGAMIRECQILLEVVLEAFDADHPLPARDRNIVIRYFNEMITVAAEEYVRIQREALQDRADRLEKMDRLKDEFLAMLGHELRNPLGAIANSLVLLRDEADRGTTADRALEIAERQMRHMKRLVDDLLDVSRISAGKVVLRIEPLDLGMAVQQAVEAARGILAHHQHVSSVSHPPERIYVNADSVRLGQCLSNLLTNAAKYTNPGGRIEVEVAREGSHALVRVRDNGIGIPADVLPDIFGLFHQAGRNLDRSGGGLGIGLTVAQRLIELHGGEIQANSEGLGKGSEFVVRLPVLEKRPARLATPRRQRTSSGLRILLVEDNVDASEVLQRILKIWGHHVTAVTDGPAALQAVSEDCPDVALVDIGLPGMSGYELAAALRANGWCPPMKLVALTGYAEDAEALAAAGFDKHMTKPADLQQLDEILGNAAALVSASSFL